MNDRDDHYRAAYGEKVTWYGLIGNIALTGFKLAGGFLGRSEALVADAVHSASDIAATAVVLFGLKIAKRPKDVSHPYGHGRIESIVSLLVGLMLIGAAAFILRDAAHHVLNAIPPPPKSIALVAVVASILSKEAMFRYTLRAGKRLNSPSIVANAWDHRSDAYSSVGVLVGIAGAKLGVPVLDPLAAGIVGMFIFKVGADIIRDAFHQLMDRSLPEETTNAMRAALSEVEGVLTVDSLRGRRIGSKILADVEIRVNGFVSARRGHDVARRAEQQLMERFPHLSEVLIHVNVDERSSQADRDRFRTRTEEILSDHREMFLEVHELEYHFSEQGREIHFHLVVPEGTTFERAHNASRHLEEEIGGAFPNTQIVIHMEPAEAKRSPGHGEILRAQLEDSIGRR